MAMLSCHDDRYRVLFEHSADAMVVYEGDGFVDCNPALLKLLGYDKPEQLYNLHPSQISPPFQSDGRPSLEKANEMMALALEQGSHRFDWTHTRANGENFPAEVLITVVPYEGRTLLHAVIRDVTRRVNIETELKRHRDHLQQLVEEQTQELRNARDKAEASSNTKSQFFRNMSHELRTPLNAIIGFSNSIKAELFGPLGHERYSEYITDIHASGEHLLALINDILDVSAIEAEKLELCEEDLNVGELIDASMRIARPLAEKRNVRLAASVCCQRSWLKGDERRLKQILLNLLSNAIKFTPTEGSVDLTVNCSEKAGHVFTVRDTGIGMDEFEIAKCMEQFGQADRPPDKDMHGTGLGLPLTQGLVHLHGGTLEIESAKGVGTTVTVRLPRERVTSH